MAKIKFTTQYDKCKTDADRARTILKRMETFEYNYISKGQKRGTYEVGPYWDCVKIDTRIFNMIKSQIKETYEHETGGRIYYYQLKKEISW